MKPNKLSNSFRIIGGSWRGRRFDFPKTPGIRPTPDRVRETLFNWLAPWIEGTNCLDLYAGSGALGLESLSRSAAYVDFVDHDSDSCRRIEAHLAVLQAKDRGRVHCGSATRFLDTAPVDFYHIVYMDPPFGQGMLPEMCQKLESSGSLKNDALIYLESEPGFDVQYLPEVWELTKRKQASKVEYHLVQRRSTST